MTQLPMSEERRICAAKIAMTDMPFDGAADSGDPKLLEVLVCPVTKGSLEGTVTLIGNLQTKGPWP